MITINVAVDGIPVKVTIERLSDHSQKVTALYRSSKAEGVHTLHPNHRRDDKETHEEIQRFALTLAKEAAGKEAAKSFLDEFHK